MVYCKSAAIPCCCGVCGCREKVEYSPYPTSPLPPSGFFPVQDLQRRVHLPFTVHVIPHNIAPTAMSQSSQPLTLTLIHTMYSAYMGYCPYQVPFSFLIQLLNCKSIKSLKSILKFWFPLFHQYQCSFLVFFLKLYITLIMMCDTAFFLWCLSYHIMATNSEYFRMLQAQF